MDIPPLPPIPRVPGLPPKTGSLPLCRENKEKKHIGWLTILNGEWQGAFYPLAYGRFTFGHAPGNNFILPAMTDVAERNHFIFLTQKSVGGVSILPGDAESLILIDDNIVMDSYPLAGGEIITVGELRLRWTSLCDEHFQWEDPLSLYTAASSRNIEAQSSLGGDPPSKEFLSHPEEKTEQTNEGTLRHFHNDTTSSSKSIFPLTPGGGSQAGSLMEVEIEPISWGEHSGIDKENYDETTTSATETALLSLPSASIPRFLSSRINCVGDREEQQDASAYWANSESWFGVVTDGAGGHILGGVAAETAIRTADTHWKASGCGARKDPDLWLVACLKNANAAIIDATTGRGRATVAALYIKNSRFYSTHLGDTRLYQIRDNEIIFRTRDDSLAQILYDQGEISESEIATHPGQSRLFKALGENRETDPNLYKGNCHPGDIFLLCTDGFWTHFDNKEIIAEFGRFSHMTYWAGPDASARSAGLRETMESMAARAVTRGNGKADNVSALIVVCSPIA